MDDLKNRNSILEKTLKGLEIRKPSQGFTRKVMVRAKRETDLIREKKDYLFIIPKLCIGGFFTLIIIFSGILLGHHNRIRISLEDEMTSALIWLMFSFIGLLVFVGLDSKLRKHLTP